MGNKRILFLGKLYPKHQKSIVLHKTADTMEIAADELEWNLIDGIEKNIASSVDICNVLPVFSFPQYYSDWRIPQEYFCHKGNARDINIGFLNFPAVKNYFIKKAIKKYIIKWLKNNGDDNLLIAYTLDDNFLKVCYEIKKKKSFEVCAIVADLPEMSNLNAKTDSLRKKYVEYKNNRLIEYMNCVDYYVLLTKHMADYLRIQKPYCVVEGIAKESKTNIESLENDKKRVVYTGTLHACFGVKTLIDAFMMIENPNYELVICGIGDSEEYIRQKAKEDRRIQFLGQVSHEEVIRIQHSANVLINPRQNTEEFTKYSFPSKTMEYLATGKPVIAYKLDGIPDEYDDYINYVKDNSTECLMETIISVCDDISGMTIQKAIAAKAFVLMNKNSVAQSKKILELCRFFV